MKKQPTKTVKKFAHGPTWNRNNFVRSLPYPFTAIVGQEEMKLGLILNVVDPLIGGVLIMGHRGTGKSTAVRGLSELVPQINVVSGCVYRCDPTSRHNLCSDCVGRLRLEGKLQTHSEPVKVV